MAKMQGLDRLVRQLRTIPQHVERATAVAMEAGAGEIVAMMKRLVPKDSGDLHDSIGWTWGDAPEGAMVLARSKSGGGSGRKVITIYAGNAQTMVGARTQFQLARIQEFGTQAMAANPYFYPSWRAGKRRVRGRIIRAMKKAIKDGAK